jgi:hypothetical protein
VSRVRKDPALSRPIPAYPTGSWTLSTVALPVSSQGAPAPADTGQIEREAIGVDYVADESLAVTGLPEEGYAQDCGITGDDAQAVPEGKAELRIDQGQEMIVEDLKGCDRHLHSGFGKGLRRDFSQQIGAVGQVGKERVQFRLHFGCVSAEQAGDQAGETEDTCS